MGSSRHSVLEHPRRHPPGRYVQPSKVARLQPIRFRSVVAGATRPARGPAWLRLYALLPLSALLCALAEYIPASLGWRRLAEGLVASVVIGLAWVWVRANRCALSGMAPDAETESEPHDLTVEVQKASPQVIPLELLRSPSER